LVFVIIIAIVIVVVVVLLLCTPCREERRGVPTPCFGTRTRLKR
jgi:hypothetical protein